MRPFFTEICDWVSDIILYGHVLDNTKYEAMQKLNGNIIKTGQPVGQNCRN